MNRELASRGGAVRSSRAAEPDVWRCESGGSDVREGLLRGFARVPWRIGTSAVRVRGRCISNAIPGSWQLESTVKMDDQVTDLALETALPADEPIFRELLGPAFELLPSRVRHLHLQAGLAVYSGEVEVERGTGLLSRLCGWATRLPPSGRGPVTVHIDADGSGESWVRHMGGHAMPSRLWAADGLLCERLGLVTFGFRITAEQGCLVWRVVRVRALGLPLPSRMFAGVAARESEEAGRYLFDVSAALPLTGLLVRYRGWLHVDPD